jgi:hypothetical protein
MKIPETHYLCKWAFNVPPPKVARASKNISADVGNFAKIFYKIFYSMGTFNIMPSIWG